MDKEKDLENRPSSQADFEELYLVFWPKIHRYITRLVGNQDAEDLTQEIFIKVEQAAANFRNESKISTWIYRIATNAAIDKIRSASYNRDTQKTLLENANDTNKLACGPKGSRPETEAINEEMNSCIHAFIDKLPDIYRTVVILSEIEGLKNKEIAEVLGLSLDVVKIRLHRGKQKLKQDLIKNCNFYRDDRNVLACEQKDPLKPK